MGALRMVGIGVVLAAVLAGVAREPVAAASPACTIQGTPRADRLVGTPARDVICGGNGSDVIRGAGGHDILRGGDGADRVFAGPGNDRAFGMRGADRIWGGPGSDYLSGGWFNDRLFAHDGRRDTLLGGPGRDVALGDREDVRRALESFSVPVPDTPRIETGPPAGRVTSSRSARFEFSSHSPVRFECSLDSAPRKPCGTGRRGSASYQGLGDGGHVFSVRAVDLAGSASSPATRAWTIDATAPRAQITGAPGNGTSRTATFRYGSSESGRFECNLDSTGFRPCGTGTSGSRTYSGLSLGAHLFEVRAVDSVDNVGAPDSHRWTIVSPPSSSDPVIAAAGDIACDPAHPNFNGGNGQNGNCRQLATSNLLVGKGYDAVLLLGDNQYYCGSYAAWLGSYDRSWGRVKGITRPSAGNHEYITQGGTLPSTGCDATNAGAAGYFRYFGSAAGDPSKGYYSYNVGAWHLIALNSNCGDAGGCGPTSQQTRWLRADLNAHKTRCTLAYWHVPLYSSGGRDEAKTRPFWQELYDANAELVLTGHDHTYERFAPQNPNAGLDLGRGIREFVVGTGGANHTSFVTVAPHSEVRNQDTYGVLELKLHPGSYEWKFVPEQGRSFSDSGTNACH